MPLLPTPRLDSERPPAPLVANAVALDLPPSLEGVSIVIPAYNEVNGIEPGLSELMQALDRLDPRIQIEVIVVDDGSTDGTRQRAESFADPRVRVLGHDQNRGYGASIKTGMHQASHRWLAITDADGTYPAHYFEKLLSLRDDHDMVVGARTKPDAQIPLVRRPPKWVLRKLASFMIQRKIPDLNSGLRVMRRSIVQRYERLLPNQFSLTTTITLVMFSAGYSVAYEPIDYLKRTGRSKIRPIQDVINFVTLIIRTVMFFNPLRVFIPLSGSFFLASFTVAFGSYYMGRLMDTMTVVLFVTGVQLMAIGMLADLVNRRGR